ncbi:MAG: aldolase [Patescibacteria group bacterium]|nr:aldolase [Patescibacteria group bacterium]
MKINVPVSVPKNKINLYKKNFTEATMGTGKLFLFAGDQKIEHLNDDFSKKLGFGNEDPEHLFKIASQANIGVFAAHLGLISHYGNDYKKIPYLVKINGKSNLIKTKDPLSPALWSVNDVISFKKASNLKILGIGYTIYLGSEYETIMLKEAAQAIKEAHENGLLAVIWIYPRGKNVKEEKSPEIIAGAAGLGLCLGADFIKLNYPFSSSKNDAKKAKEITVAAGRSGIIFSGGKKINEKNFLENIENQIKTAGARGCAIGRNIHQNSLGQAVKLSQQIKKIAIK